MSSPAITRCDGCWGQGQLGPGIRCTACWGRGYVTNPADPVYLATLAALRAPAQGDPYGMTGPEATWLQGGNSYFQALYTEKLTAGSFSVGPSGVGLSVLAPSGDTGGGTDSGALAAAVAIGSVLMLPGTWYLSQMLSWAMFELLGIADGAVTIQPGGAWAGGAALLNPGTGAAVTKVRGYGGSGSRVANPAADFIQVQAGAQWWRIQDVRSDNMNGHIWYVNPVTGSHGRVRGVAGEHNAYGGAVDNGLGGSVTAEISVRDLDIQNCEVGEVLSVSAATDVNGGDINGSILAGIAANAISINGSCQTVQLDNLDVGGGTGTGVVVVSKNGGSSSPSDIRLQGKAQGGAVGVVVSDACSRVAIDMLAARNQGDGFLFNGTGNGIQAKIRAHLNNQSSGGNDVDITSSAHVFLTGPAYDVGGPVVANLNITLAGNHVTEANPPAGRTATGFAPAGW